MAIYSYAKAYINEIADFMPNFEISKIEYMDTSEYINNMGNNKFWAGDIEINFASYIFGLKIVLYNDNTNNEDEDIFENDEFEYINTILISENKEEKPIMILLHINNNHYQLLYFSEDIEEDIKLKSLGNNKEKIKNLIKKQIILS